MRIIETSLFIRLSKHSSKQASWRRNCNGIMSTHLQEQKEDNEGCATGIVEGGRCDPNTKFPVPSGGPAVFYTTWSYYGIWTAVGLLAATMLCVLGTPLRTSAALRYAVFPLTGMLLANSVMVNMVSQMLLAFNFKLTGPGAAPGMNAALTTDMFQNVMKVNFQYHVMPGVVGAFAIVILLLTNRCASRLHLNPWVMILLFILWQVGFVASYMAVPLRSTGATAEKRAEKCLFGFDKIQAVYNHPNPLLWLGMATASVALAGLIGSQLA